MLNPSTMSTYAGYCIIYSTTTPLLLPYLLTVLIIITKPSYFLYIFVYLLYACHIAIQSSSLTSHFFVNYIQIAYQILATAIKASSQCQRCYCVKDSTGCKQLKGLNVNFNGSRSLIWGNRYQMLDRLATCVRPAHTDNPHVRKVQAPRQHAVNHQNKNKGI